ncbi:YhcH/YjgK/YiaL family protein [Echinicola marina]|uniref:YhcH/YjgK/YiaL family protein n=1 Tax=Echinicola marina TaxID=2859768 RepID=UPI001CF69BE3|nr:YhcH/YjgK/YiaL family protein [Echinicola marina]UCS93243.1 YhcH/YjgK/YiaL family protein [Echinicola marina]
MIFDKTENLKNYGERFQFVLDDLHGGSFEKGKKDINEPDCFSIGLVYQTQNSDRALWESHRKYLDIHVILEGEELIHLADIASMVPTNEYQDDYQLFEGREQQTIRLSPGYFLILFPHEVHRTSIAVNNSLEVKKKVYKKLL